MLILTFFVCLMVACGGPWASGSSLNDVCKSGKRFIAHPDDCAKYIRCDSYGNVFAIYTCPGSLLFDEKYNVCDQPYNVKCDKQSTTTTTTTTTVTQATLALEQNDARSLDLDDAASTTTTEIPNMINICESDSHLVFGRSFVRDPADCSVYVKCEEKLPVMTYKCDNSQLFDEERGVCDDAENVVCDIAAKTTTPVTTTVALDLETTTVINGRYCSVGKVFARHPTDCTKYIRCDTNGDTVMVVQCPGYFVFNAQSNICDEPSRVDCATGLEITTTTISYITTTIPADIQTTNFETVDMLSEACTGKRLVQHPSDCSKYIVCDANRIAVKLFQCPGIQLFNEEIGICDQAYNVRCKIDGTTVLTASSSTTTKAPEANSCSNSANNLPESTTCNKYFSCTPGQTITIMC